MLLIRLQDPTLSRLFSAPGSLGVFFQTLLSSVISCPKLPKMKDGMGGGVSPILVILSCPRYVCLFLLVSFPANVVVVPQRERGAQSPECQRLRRRRRLAFSSREPAARKPAGSFSLPAHSVKCRALSMSAHSLPSSSSASCLFCPGPFFSFSFLISSPSHSQTR